MQTFHEDRPHLCSLWVFHDTQTLQEDTKELVEEYPISPREVVADAFQKHIQSWKESDMCSQLVQVLDSSATTLEINKIVGVALGTISQYTEDSRNRSAFQHALVLTLREWLLQTKQDFPCYVQDPNYNPVDHSILGEYGVEVIDDPRAWLEIDEMSILFSCSPNVPVKEIVADIARPAVVIWEHVGFRDYDKEGKGSV